MANTPRKAPSPKAQAPVAEASAAPAPALAVPAPEPVAAAPAPMPELAVLAAPPAEPLAATPSVDYSVVLEPIARMQEQVRETTERGLESLRSNYATLRDNAEKATGRIEESFTAASDGSRNLTQKAIEVLRVNSLAAFAHAEALFAARTLAEAAQLQQEFARAQFEALQAQAREFAELAQSVGTRMTDPIKQGFASTH